MSTRGARPSATSRSGAGATRSRADSRTSLRQRSGSNASLGSSASGASGSAAGSATGHTRNRSGSRGSRVGRSARPAGSKILQPKKNGTLKKPPKSPVRVPMSEATREDIIAGRVRVDDESDTEDVLEAQIMKRDSTMRQRVEETLGMTAKDILDELAEPALRSEIDLLAGHSSSGSGSEMDGINTKAELAELMAYAEHSDGSEDSHNSSLISPTVAAAAKMFRDGDASTKRKPAPNMKPRISIKRQDSELLAKKSEDIMSKMKEAEEAAAAALAMPRESPSNVGGYNLRPESATGYYPGQYSRSNSRNGRASAARLSPDDLGGFGPGGGAAGGDKSAFSRHRHRTGGAEAGRRGSAFANIAQRRKLSSVGGSPLLAPVSPQMEGSRRRASILAINGVVPPKLSITGLPGSISGSNSRRGSVATTGSRSSRSRRGSLVMDQASTRALKSAHKASDAPLVSAPSPMVGKKRPLSSLSRPASRATSTPRNIVTPVSVRENRVPQSRPGTADNPDFEPMTPEQALEQLRGLVPSDGAGPDVTPESFDKLCAPLIEQYGNVKAEEEQSNWAEHVANRLKSLVTKEMYLEALRVLQSRTWTDRTRNVAALVIALGLCNDWDNYRLFKDAEGIAWLVSCLLRSDDENYKAYVLIVLSLVAEKDEWVHVVASSFDIIDCLAAAFPNTPFQDRMFIILDLADEYIRDHPRDFIWRVDQELLNELMEGKVEWESLSVDERQRVLQIAPPLKPVAGFATEDEMLDAIYTVEEQSMQIKSLQAVVDTAEADRAKDQRRWQKVVAVREATIDEWKEKHRVVERQLEALRWRYDTDVKKLSGDQSAKVELFETEIQEYKQTIKEQVEKLVETNMQAEELKAVLEEQTAHNRDLVKTLAITEQDANALEDEVTQIQKRHEKQLQEAARLWKATKQKLEEMEKKVEYYNVHNKSLKSTMNAIETENKHLKEAHKAINDMSHNLEEENARLRTDVQGAYDARDELQQLYEELKKKDDEHDSIKESFKRQLIATRMDLDEWKDRFETLSTSVGGVGGDRVEAISQLNSGLQDKVSQLEQELAHVTVKYHRAKATIDALQKEKSELMQMLEEVMSAEGIQ